MLKGLKGAAGAAPTPFSGRNAAAANTLASALFSAEVAAATAELAAELAAEGRKSRWRAWRRAALR